MNSDIAISVKNVSKNFKLPHEKADSVKSLFVSPFNKNRKKFEVQHALNDISFDVPKGEFFGIIGRNGSGKSTLLKIIAGIYQPNKGSVSVEGRLVPFIELGVGFNPELTGRENVYLNGALMGFSEKEVDDKYKSIVDFAELERFMDQKLKNYSSGMQVRLAFSVATVLADSDVLLIDEVLAVGDADFQRKCFNYFKQLKKNKKTVVFVSHDMSAIREYCDRAVLVEKSKIICSGSSDKVAKEYSRLFVDNQVTTSAKSPDRWGDAGARTESVTVNADDDDISIVQIIRAEIEMDNPIVGFRLRDSAGREVFGTNTKLENRKIGKVKPHQQIVLTWRMKNILSDGEYKIDPAILHEDEITTADWWDDAVTITIKKDKRLPYAIDPGFKLDIGGSHD